MNAGYSAPESTPNNIAPSVQSISALSGTASGDSEVVEVNLTVRDDDLDYYWNGITFQSAPTQVRANISGAGNNVSWSYDFPRPLAAGEYTVSSEAVDNNGAIQSSVSRESFSVTPNFVSTGDGSWGPVIQTPSIAVAAANLPDGKILHWAAYQPDTYMPSSGDFQQTYTSIFDPITG